MIKMVRAWTAVSVEAWTGPFEDGSESSQFLPAPRLPAGSRQSADAHAPPLARRAACWNGTRSTRTPAASGSMLIPPLPRISWRLSQSMRSSSASAAQLASSPLPPKLRNGSVNPLVGSSPRFTPMLMMACTPSQMPMPCATSAEK